MIICKFGYAFIKLFILFFQEVDIKIKHFSINLIVIIFVFFVADEINEYLKFVVFIEVIDFDLGV